MKITGSLFRPKMENKEEINDQGLDAVEMHGKRNHLKKAGAEIMEKRDYSKYG